MQSIQAFPKMMTLRPMIVDEKFLLLGGNMRRVACERLGMKEVPDDWVKQEKDLTEEEKAEFIIKDNVGFGEWEWEVLLKDWNADDLPEWGLDLPDWTADTGRDYTADNKELDGGNVDAHIVMKLHFSLADYETVRQGLLQIAETPEEAVKKLLNASSKLSL
jgi:hypothetical protein